MFILYIILGIVVLPFVLALFVNGSYFIHRSQNIQASKADVFAYLKILNNSRKYSKWVMADPNMETQMIGNDGEVGFILSWDSKDKQVGAGAQQIKQIVENERIDYEIRFLRPFKSVATSFIEIKAISENETEVKWAFSGKMNYPMNFIMLFISIDKILGKDLELSLVNLKGILEQQIKG